jgi:triosephosphate isomerase
MKAVVTPPYFEVGIKNYIYGDAVIALAEEAEACAEESDVDVVLITPYTEIRRVADRTSRIIILAPYMDTLRPGRTSSPRRCAMPAPMASCSTTPSGR